MNLSYDKIKKTLGQDTYIDAIILKLAIYGISFDTDELCDVLNYVADHYHSFVYDYDIKNFNTTHKFGVVGYSDIIFKNIFLLLFTTDFFKDVDKVKLLKFTSKKLDDIIKTAKASNYKNKIDQDLIEIFAELKDRLEGKIS